MTKNMKCVAGVDGSTMVEMTDDEVEMLEADLVASLNEKAVAQQTAVKKAALLVKLGITDDEAKLLLS